MFKTAIILISFLFPFSLFAGAEIGFVKSVEGSVMVCPDEGQAFAPAKVGQKVFSGGVIVAMEDGSVVLEIKGKGELTLTDNAALKLKEVAATGEYSAVTGVRAPVLFLYPTGETDDLKAGQVSVTFGINHSLDKVKGVKEYRLFLLHEDVEDELDEPDGPAALKAAQVVAKFKSLKKPATNTYSWYTVKTKKALEKSGEYTLFVGAKRGKEWIRLGQSTLLVIEEPEE